MFFAQIRLYEPCGETADGLLFLVPGGLDWHQISYLEPEQCQHEETMCRACVDSWEADHEVVLPIFI